MAFPVVEDSTSGFEGTGLVTLPDNPQAGETLISCVHQADGTQSTNTVSGWTRFFHDTEGSTLARDTRLALYWRKSDGTEGGNTVDFATSHTTWTTYRISGATDPTSQPPEAASKATGSSASPDPPSLTPSGGPKDFLWIPVAGQAAESVASGAPTNYGSLLSATAGTQNAEDETTIATAHRTAQLSTEDPDSFSFPVSQRWISTLIAVHPASGSTGSSLPLLLGYEDY